MKTLVAVFLLFVLAITCNAQKLDGNWKAKMMGPNGDMELVYSFKVNADTLKGNVTSEMGSLPLENGKVKGNEFSFDINVNGQAMSCTGILDGDVAKLTLPMMEQPVVLNRVIESAKIEGSKIDGKWLAKMSNPQGDMELTFTFKVDGNKLTGKNSSPMGEMDLTNGVVNGNDFSFDIDANGMTVNHKGKYLDDDSIEIKINVNDQEMAMKLARVAQ
jgi:hypothetical protein